jgi:hypothetical protein
MIIKIDAILPNKNAISYAQSEILYNLLKENFKNEESITIDFKNITVVSSPFFNGSIGLLLKNIKIEELQKKVKFINISDDAKAILNIVIKNALEHYKKTSN